MQKIKSDVFFSPSGAHPLTGPARTIKPPDGENELTFQLDGCVSLRAQLFVWPENSKIIVTDIEGEWVRIVV